MTNKSIKTVFLSIVALALFLCNFVGVAAMVAYADVAETPHEHVYNQTVLVVEATETTKAEYSLTCVCGAEEEAQTKVYGSSLAVKELYLVRDKELTIFPEGYKLGDETYLHNGSYVIYGSANKDIRFWNSESGETSENIYMYDVVFHDFVGSSWRCGLLGISPSVIVNMTVKGINNFHISDDYIAIIQTSNGSSDFAPVLNLSLGENSSVDFYNNCSANGTDHCISSSIDFNLLNGETNLDLTSPYWRMYDLVITNGTPTSHTEYTYRNMYECLLECEDCGIEEVISHSSTVKRYTDGDETYAEAHDSICSHCNAVIGQQTHTYMYSDGETVNYEAVDENYCAPTCLDCGYHNLEQKEEHVPAIPVNSYDPYKELSCAEKGLCETCWCELERYEHNFVDDGSTITCTECNQEVSFLITVGEDEWYCTNVMEAFDEANGKNATIKLLRDVTHYQEASPFINSGNVTFDLAGFTLTFDDGLYGMIGVGGDAVLTVKDSSAEGTGKIVLSNSYSSMFNVYENSKLIIESGTFSQEYMGSIAYIMHQDSNEYSSIIIKGGNFSTSGLLFGVSTCAPTIPEVTEIEIYGGNFTCNATDDYEDIYLEDYTPHSQFDMKIYGGEFNVLDLGDTNTVSNILAGSCCSYVDENGNPIEITEGQTSFTSSIKIVHEDNFVYTGDGTHHWLECSTCGLTQGESEEHTGGEATCTNQAVCTVCSQTYGELEPHVYGDWVVTKEATKTEAGEKTKTCVCGHTLTEVIPAIEDTGLSVGAIIGIIAGSVAGVGIIVFVTIWLAKKKKKIS